MSKVRSRHMNLLNYFIFKPQDLGVSYVKQCEKFFKDIGVTNVIRNERPCNCKKKRRAFSDG